MTPDHTPSSHTVGAEKAFVPFNLNEYVRVKLNERGLEILRERHERLFHRVPQVGPFEGPKTDTEGWSRFQGWEFMQIFGAHMRLGPPPPFELTIEFEVSASALSNGEHSRGGA